MNQTNSPKQMNLLWSAIKLLLSICLLAKEFILGVIVNLANLAFMNSRSIWFYIVFSLNSGYRRTALAWQESGSTQREHIDAGKPNSHLKQLSVSFHSSSRWFAFVFGHDWLLHFKKTREQSIGGGTGVAPWRFTRSVHHGRAHRANDPDVPHLYVRYTMVHPLQRRTIVLDAKSILHIKELFRWHASRRLGHNGNEEATSKYWFDSKQHQMGALCSGHILWHNNFHSVHQYAIN